MISLRRAGPHQLAAESLEEGRARSRARGGNGSTQRRVRMIGHERRTAVHRMPLLHQTPEAQEI
jgi:hypothetical protein